MNYLNNILQLGNLDEETVRNLGVHFGANGEDVLVLSILRNEHNNKGMYFDFGAYHPIKYSLTYLLYQIGWRGVNVDANSHSIKLFDKHRPDDKNICALVSDNNDKARYVSFREGAYNTCNEQAINTLIKRECAEFDVINDKILDCTTPNELLDQYVGSRKLDYLNIDLEGIDEKILYSIDLYKYRPKVITIEINFKTVTSENFTAFLADNHYNIVGFYKETTILKSIKII
jgi:hypothetical protein